MLGVVAMLATAVCTEPRVGFHPRRAFDIPRGARLDAVDIF
jgi:hypothetical protein